DHGDRAQVGDRDAAGEGLGRDAERAEVQQILATRRVGVEAGDSVGAEAGGEDEDVVARPAVERVAARSTGDDVVAAAGDNHIVAALAIDDVGLVAEGDGVVALAADDALDARENIATDLGARRRARGDGGARRGGGQVVGVEAGATVVGVVAVARRGNEAVVAGAAADVVRTGTAREPVVAAAAAQRVVAGAADDAVVERVAGAGEAARAREGQVLHIGPQRVGA